MYSIVFPSVTLSKPVNKQCDEQCNPIPNGTADAVDDTVVIIITLSGGGKRAAAFGYGVLLGLEEARLAGSAKYANVLSAVDMISAVSGGSIPAMYYGLNRQPFARFDSSGKFYQFLMEQTNISLFWKSVYPWNWFQNSTEILADYFGEVVGEQTFSKLGTRPHLIIGSTNLSNSGSFRFRSEDFKSINSDLGQFPLKYALAASAAYPVFFPTVALRDFAPESIAEKNP